MSICKPKLLVLTSSYPKYKGDINGNFVYELSSRLICDFDVYVLAPSYKGSLSFEIVDKIKIYRHNQFLTNNVELAYGVGIYENLKKNKFKYFILLFYLIYLVLAIIKISKKEKINIIHAHWLIPNALIAVLCKKIFRCKFKIFATIHGSDFWGFSNKLGNYLKKYTLKNIDVLTVVSHAIKEKLLEMKYKKNIYVYPMGVDTTLFSPEKKDITLKEKLKIKGFFLLYVGVIVEQKGIRYLIHAMPLIIKEHPDTKLVVIGDGNLKNEMIILAKKLNISEDVIFTGAIPHDDLPSYFATADLFILPSFSEGFGLVVIEAMSCKTLAVTLNLSVIHDIITENETGFYFDEINKVAISQKINFIFQNKEKYEHIREKGRKYVIDNFDWDIVRDNYTNLFKYIT